MSATLQLELDGCAAPPARKDAILVAAHLSHPVGESQTGGHQGQDGHESHHVHHHPVPVVVGVFAPFVSGEIRDGGNRRPARTTAKWQHAPFRRGQRRLIVVHLEFRCSARGGCRQSSTGAVAVRRQYDMAALRPLRGRYRDDRLEYRACVN